MDEKEILNKIIEEDGNCCWSNESICKRCPIGKLKQKADGTYINCIETVSAEFLSEEEADARYKTIAEKLLVDEAIDDILRGIDVTH